jgi:undecaprenyl-diphosphatase
MIDFINTLDTKVFLELNQMHAPFWDYFMSAFSGKVIWVPMYATVAYLMFKNLSWKVALSFLIAIALIIALSDMTCAKVIRPFAERLRPANIENPISHMVHIVENYRGGAYGFPSCHAANSFAFVTFLAMIIKNRLLLAFAFSWAVVNCYSRIYLGVHYTGDIIVGALVGSIIAWLVVTATRKIVTEKFEYNQPEYQHAGIFPIVQVLIIVGIAVYSFIKVY